LAIKGYRPSSPRRRDAGEIIQARRAAESPTYLGGRGGRPSLVQKLSVGQSRRRPAQADVVLECIFKHTRLRQKTAKGIDGRGV